MCEQEEPWNLQAQGYAWLRKAIDPEPLRQEVERLIEGKPVHGVRRLLHKSPRLRQRAQDCFGLQLPGQDLIPLRGILFDKPPGSNWNLSWHRDLIVGVPKRAELPGFTSWCLKEGQHHVQPPRKFLEQMLTVRIHLDPTPKQNGALRVIPGSHLEHDEDSGDEETLSADPGDVLLMRPLLMHASSPSEEPARRRIIHVEYVPHQVLPAALRS